MRRDRVKQACEQDRVRDVVAHVIERNAGTYDKGFIPEIPDRLLGLKLSDASIGLAVRELDAMRFEREKRTDERSKLVVKFLFNVSATIQRW